MSTTVRDFKGRLYSIVQIGIVTTLLRDQQDDSLVRVRSHGWEELGFTQQHDEGYNIVAVGGGGAANARDTIYLGLENANTRRT